MNSHNEGSTKDHEGVGVQEVFLVITNVILDEMADSVEFY